MIFRWNPSILCTIFHCYESLAIQTFVKLCWHIWNHQQANDFRSDRVRSSSDFSMRAGLMDFPVVWRLLDHIFHQWGKTFVGRFHWGNFGNCISKIGNVYGNEGKLIEHDRFFQGTWRLMRWFLDFERDADPIFAANPNMRKEKMKLKLLLLPQLEPWWIFGLFKRDLHWSNMISECSKLG